MKLPNILLLIILLSNNYVISQTNCPKNGIKTDDGNCFYLSKEDCPPPWKDTGVIENDADYAIISDLFRKTQTRERVCMSIYDSDFKNILNRQPEYMKKLREENQILLDKPIQFDESLHIAFRIKNSGKYTTMTIQDSTKNDIYFGKIEIGHGNLRLSANTEVESDQKVENFEFNSHALYELDIRFIGNRVQVFAEHAKLIEIELSLKTKYSANMVSIENMEVYQLEHHDIKCQSEVTYFLNNPDILKEDDTSLRSRASFERTIIEKLNMYSDTGKHEMILPRINEFAENIIFHLIGHHNSSQFDFNVQFMNSDSTTSFEYGCSHGQLTIKYQTWVYQIFGNGYFKWDEISVLINPSSHGFTFSMFESDPPTMIIYLQSEGEPLKTSPIHHPCLKNNVMEKECNYPKEKTVVKSRSSYITGFRYIEEEILAKYCFYDYWISEITTKVPYQSDCGTEKHLNICRIRRNAHSESYQPLSTESMISDEQDEKLAESTTFFGVKIVRTKPASVVTPCFFLAFCLFLNLVNVIFECLQR